MAGICTCWDENNLYCADCESEINSFEECCTEECGCNNYWELKMRLNEQPKWNQIMENKFRNRSLQRAYSKRNVQPKRCFSHLYGHSFKLRRLNLVNLAARVLHPRDKYCERRHVFEMNTFQKLLDTPCSSLLSLNEINCSIKQTPTKKIVAKKDKGLMELLFHAKDNQEIDFWQKIGPNSEKLPFGVVPMERNKSQLQLQVWSPIFPETKTDDDTQSSQDENTFRKHRLVLKSSKQNTNFKKSSKIGTGKNKNNIVPLTKHSSNQTGVLPTLTLHNNKNNHHVEVKTFSEASKPSSLSPTSRPTRGYVKETASSLSVLCPSRSSVKLLVDKHVFPCVQLVDRSTSPLREVMCQCTPTTYLSCSENTHISPVEFSLSQRSIMFDKETSTIQDENFPVNHRSIEPTSHLCLAALFKEDTSSYMSKSHQANLHPEIQGGINMDTKFLRALNSSSTNYPDLFNSFLTQPIEPCQVQIADVSETVGIFPRLAKNQLEFENKISAGTKIESSGKTGEYGRNFFLEHEDVFREGYHVKTQTNLDKIDYYDIVDDSETLANIVGERAENYFTQSPESMRNYSSLPSSYRRYFERPKSAGYETLTIPVDKSNSVHFYDQSNNLKSGTSSCPSKICIAISPKQDEIEEREPKEFDFKDYNESDTGNISQQYRPIIKSKSETIQYFKSDFFENNHESFLPESKFPFSIGTQTLTIMPKCDEKSIVAKSCKSLTEEFIKNNFKHTCTDDNSRVRVKTEANFFDIIAQTEENYHCQINSPEKLEHSQSIIIHDTENKPYNPPTVLHSSFKNKSITERMRRISSLKYAILRNLILNRAASKIKMSALSAISQLKHTTNNASMSYPISRGLQYNFNHESSSIDKENIIEDRYMEGSLDRNSNVVEHLWNQNEGCLITSFISRCAVLSLSLIREPNCCYFNKLSNVLNTFQQYEYEFDVNKLNHLDSESDENSRINPIPQNGAKHLRSKQSLNSSNTLNETKSISGNLTKPTQKSVYTQVDFGFGKPFDGKESEIENISYDLSISSDTTTNLGGLTMGRTSPLSLVGLNPTSSLPFLEFHIRPCKEQPHMLLGPVPTPVTPAHAVTCLKETSIEGEHRSDSSSENHLRGKRSLMKTTKRVFTRINPFTRSKRESKSS